MKNGSAGVVNAGELYTLSQIRTRLGLTDSAMRQLRRRGLPIIRVGKRGYASGRKVIEFFERLFDANSREGRQPRPETPGASLEGPDDGRHAAEVRRHGE